MIIYLDNFLILGRILEDVIMSRDTVNLLLENPGFFINIKKLILQPTKNLEYLRMVTGSLEMALSLPSKKVESISKMYQNLMQMEEAFVRELSSLQLRQ